MFPIQADYSVEITIVRGKRHINGRVCEQLILLVCNYYRALTIWKTTVLRAIPHLIHKKLGTIIHCFPMKNLRLKRISIITRTFHSTFFFLSFFFSSSCQISFLIVHGESRRHKIGSPSFYHHGIYLVSPAALEKAPLLYIRSTLVCVMLVLYPLYFSRTSSVAFLISSESQVPLSLLGHSQYYTNVAYIFHLK